MCHFDVLNNCLRPPCMRKMRRMCFVHRTIRSRIPVVQNKHEPYTRGFNISFEDSSGTDDAQLCEFKAQDWSDLHREFDTSTTITLIGSQQSSQPEGEDLWLLKYGV